MGKIAEKIKEIYQKIDVKVGGYLPGGVTPSEVKESKTEGARTEKTIIEKLSPTTITGGKETGGIITGGATDIITPSDVIKVTSSEFPGQSFTSLEALRTYEIQQIQKHTQDSKRVQEIEKSRLHRIGDYYRDKLRETDDELRSRRGDRSVPRDIKKDYDAYHKYIFDRETAEKAKEIVPTPIPPKEVKPKVLKTKEVFNIQTGMFETTRDDPGLAKGTIQVISTRLPTAEEKIIIEKREKNILTIPTVTLQKDIKEAGDLQTKLTGLSEKNIKDEKWVGSEKDLKEYNRLIDKYNKIDKTIKAGIGEGIFARDIPITQFEDMRPSGVLRATGGSILGGVGEVVGGLQEKIERVTPTKVFQPLGFVDIDKKELGRKAGEFIGETAIGFATFPIEVVEFGVIAGKTIKSGEKFTKEQKIEGAILAGVILTAGAIKFAPQIKTITKKGVATIGKKGKEFVEFEKKLLGNKKGQAQVLQDLGQKESDWIYDNVKGVWVRKSKIKDQITRVQATSGFAEASEEKQLSILRKAFSEIKDDGKILKKVYLDEASLLKDIEKAKKFMRESGLKETQIQNRINTLFPQLEKIKVPVVQQEGFMIQQLPKVKPKVQQIPLMQPQVQVLKEPQVQAEKVGQVISPVSVQVGALGLAQVPVTKQAESQLFAPTIAQAQAQPQIELFAPAVLQAPAQPQLEKIKEKEKLKPKLTSLTLLNELLDMKQIQRPGIPKRPGEPIKPKVTKVPKRIKLFGEAEREIKEKKVFENSFDVGVIKSGEEKIIAKGLNRKDAMDVGAKRVLETLRATFFLKKSLQKAEDIPDTNVFNRNRRFFRPPKQNSKLNKQEYEEVHVQKKRKVGGVGSRLGMKGEIFEIGQATKSKKKKGKRSIWDF